MFCYFIIVFLKVILYLNNCFFKMLRLIEFYFYFLKSKLIDKMLVLLSKGSFGIWSFSINFVSGCWRFLSK